MTEVVPEFPDLDQLRRQAKELHKSAQRGDPGALSWLACVSDRVDLNSAQLALARHFGMPSWPRLKLEVDRKNSIHSGDVEGLRRLLAEHPDLAREPVSSCFENDSALGYIGVARFHGLTEHDRAGELARVLISAGSSPDGVPGTREPPLVTAASYGEVDIVRILIDSGADLESTGFAVEDGTALAHAVEFGNTEVVDILVEAGAVVHDLVEAAGAGELHGFLRPGTSSGERARALRAAVVCERLDVIDQLLATGLTVDADPDTGAPSESRTVLHDAAYHGKIGSVRHLLALGADPNLRDGEYGSTPLGWCRHRREELAVFGEHLISAHREVEPVLEPLTEES